MDRKFLRTMTGALFAAAFCAGCTSDDPATGLARATGFATATPETKDFVRESRPAELEYIPVGTRAERPNRKMTPDEFKAIEADLNTRRQRNEAAGASAKAAGATPPPAPIKLPPPVKTTE